ncbi:phycobilisome rod-core linker polypeptide [Roseofilum reptotaenium CS-1145]|uniref:Phycobilisome rod-core linker polypeptide CpcG n=1 Tax=Roseofilum reptotaenium AO1-A TaxID=1925591 RepID=A0A1L9QLI1_9CYAN|nr:MULTISPECIES: phycobilisome rod-core linker polypeptide [Roseofilum]MBP0030560.1 phycobilisome rod-core linker polypeptide [Roseofilum sp. Guam]MDB9516952.1 phycobilisome rod-core linker polypeptide [Roseofilum reptotaenium CS-1145]OJJ19749.1 phycobilisome rod-core linker polypeptide CpcG [Roseofilum reptotaenium AO1-A]
MTIPLLEYSPTTQNQRVEGFEIASPEKPRIYTTEGLPSSVEVDELIWAAYRQIFNEQQLIYHNYKNALESQLRAGQITVRDFIRSLLLSESFRRNNYEPNSNYRFVELCIQRVLGREVYGEREKLAWSIVLATQGLNGFVDQLLNTEEYLTHFGYDTVPYQRRRILPQRSQGNLPSARMPRYGEDYRQKLESLGYFPPLMPTYRWSWQRPPYPGWVRLTGRLIALTGGGLLTLGVVAVALAAWGVISL